MQSQEIGKLAEALAKAQGEMDSAKKDSVNPHFKSKYADLASVIEALKAPFAQNNLSYVQYTQTTETGIELVTMLMHTSGEWISGALKLTLSKPDMQGLGSALTYARRYSLSAIAGLAQDDDDGNAASSHDRGMAGRVYIEPPRAKFPKKEEGFGLTDMDKSVFIESAKDHGYTTDDIAAYFKPLGKQFKGLNKEEYSALLDHFTKPKFSGEMPVVHPDFEAAMKDMADLRNVK